MLCTQHWGGETGIQSTANVYAVALLGGERSLMIMYLKKTLFYRQKEAM